MVSAPPQPPQVGETSRFGGKPERNLFSLPSRFCVDSCKPTGGPGGPVARRGGRHRHPNFARLPLWPDSSQRLPRLGRRAQGIVFGMKRSAT